MKLIQGTHNKVSKFAPQDFDFISNMPDDVVSNILNRLPLQEAVRTGILSKNWRYKWNMLSHLVFDRSLYYLCETDSYWGIVSRLLLLLKGAITKFVLYIEGECHSISDDEQIANWILFLSRKGVKDLTLWKWRGDPLELPSHLFSCLELKRLDLNNCRFDPPASFHGFPNLLSFELEHLNSGNFGELFTQCPILESLNLGYSDFQGHVKLVEIAKLTNLKMLTLFLCNLDKTTITSSGGIFELVGFLPKLQVLDLNFYECKCFIEDGATKRISTTFLCIKTVQLSHIDLDNSIMLAFAFEIIRSSPNLQTLGIRAGEQDADPPLAIRSLKVDYNTMELVQLQSVVFGSLKGSENEVCLIRYLLGCSPFLKEMVICPSFNLESEEKLMFARKLLKLHHASTNAEISFL